MYFHKKYRGFYLALIIVFPKFISALIKAFIYTLLNKPKSKDLYYCRLSGILNSIKGNKSWYRPRLN